MTMIWCHCVPSEEHLVKTIDNKSAQSGFHILGILFVIYMDKISRHKEDFGSLRIASLLFADDVVIMALPEHDLQCSQEQFPGKCETVVMRITTSKSENMVLCKRMVDCPLWVGGELIPQLNGFKHFVL